MSEKVTGLLLPTVSETETKVHPLEKCPFVKVFPGFIDQNNVSIKGSRSLLRIPITDNNR